MNLSPSAVLVIILVAAVANILIILAVAARSRADRARQFVEVDGFLSSSYADPGSRESEPQSGDRSLASDDRWPTARERWTDVGAGWLAPTDVDEPGSRPAEPVESASEPFEYPDDEDDPDDEADDAQMDGAEMQVADTDEAQAVGDDVEVEVEETVGAAGVAEDSPADEVQTPDAVAAIAMGGTISAPRGRDPLTGLLDAMAFEEALSHEEAREQRYGRPATVIVFELDGLAKLVDRLGSEPGDRIETALGDSIMRLARRADYVARLERGRYAVLLPETDEVAAINYVERIRRACDLWLESGAIAMRLAIGWASTAGDAGLAGAVRVATERMRVELRRNARQAGEVAVEADAVADDGDAVDIDETAEAAAGL